MGKTQPMGSQEATAWMPSLQIWELNQLTWSWCSVTESENRRQKMILLWETLPSNEVAPDSSRTQSSRPLKEVHLRASRTNLVLTSTLGFSRGLGDRWTKVSVFVGLGSGSSHHAHPSTSHMSISAGELESPYKSRSLYPNKSLKCYHHSPVCQSAHPSLVDCTSQGQGMDRPQAV